MATTMLDHVDHFFDLPTGLFWIGCFTAELGAREAEGLGASLKYSMIILYLWTWQQKKIQVTSVVFYRGEKLLQEVGCLFIRVSP